MMALKHVDKAGCEYVFPCAHMNFVPAEAKDCAPAADSLWWYSPEGSATELVDGKVYLMNEHGTTVARYELDFDGPTSKRNRGNPLKADSNGDYPM